MRRRNLPPPRSEKKRLSDGPCGEGTGQRGEQGGCSSASRLEGMSTWRITSARAQTSAGRAALSDVNGQLEMKPATLDNSGL